MKNRNLVYARQEVKMYRDHYRPSFNVLRIMKSILGVLIFGHSTTVAHDYLPVRKRIMR
jgi:hypothetical protein